MVGYDFKVISFASKVHDKNPKFLNFVIKKFVEIFQNDFMEKRFSIDLKVFKKNIYKVDTAKKLVLLVLNRRNNDNEFFGEKVFLDNERVISRIIRFIELTFHLFEYWDMPYPSTLLPSLTKRDAFYRPGVDEIGDLLIWEYPLKSRKERFTQCKYCLKSAGLISLLVFIIFSFSIIFFHHR